MDDRQLIVLLVQIIQRLPPLPNFPFPAQLPAAALTKSLPEKPVIKVARINDPQGVALLWNIDHLPADPAPMAHYFIYTAQQRNNGTFTPWKTIGELKAVPLPMACRVAAHANGKSLFFAIIGKDIYGRYGPYSEIFPLWSRDV